LGRSFTILELSIITQVRAIRLNFKKEVCFMKKRGMILVLCLLISTSMIFGGCANMTPAQEGATVGAGAGAVAGAILGGSTKKALIGAGIGALGGALLNDEMKKDKK
jgi:osmotically inducible lipoprotein OsmB